MKYSIKILQQWNGLYFKGQLPNWRKIWWWGHTRKSIYKYWWFYIEASVHTEYFPIKAFENTIEHSKDPVAFAGYDEGNHKTFTYVKTLEIRIKLLINKIIRNGVKSPGQFRTLTSNKLLCFLMSSLNNVKKIKRATEYSIWDIKSQNYFSRKFCIHRLSWSRVGKVEERQRDQSPKICNPFKGSHKDPSMSSIFILTG